MVQHAVVEKGPQKSAAVSDVDIDKVLGLAPFHLVDAACFPNNAALRQIIRKEARIRVFRRGDVLARGGDRDYSVFGILEGSARALVGWEAEQALFPVHPVPQPSWIRALFRVLRPSPSYPEIRDSANVPLEHPHLRFRDLENGERADARVQAYLADVDRFFASVHSEPLPSGRLFGEIAALTHSPRAATIIADADSLVVELSRSGLREIWHRVPAFRTQVDEREWVDGVMLHLARTPLFRTLDRDVLELIASQTQFEAHGQFDWAQRVRQQTERGKLVDHETLIAGQGDYADSLIVIRAGLSRVAQRHGDGHQTVHFMAENDLFGFGELFSRWHDGTDARLQHSLLAVGYADIFRVPGYLLEEHVFPNMPPQDPGNVLWCVQKGPLPEDLLDFFVDCRAINGTATMVIDIRRCIGCDDCVRACARNHDGNPRFLPDGIDNGRLLVAKACMHCFDPTCLVGCPTGAIHRLSEGGWVVVDEASCIGCGHCAHSCPHDNIRMVELRDRTGKFMLDEATRQPIRKATKCDMCFDAPNGPACQRACPRDAMIRLDIRQVENLACWKADP
ncbi:MAG: cyclic nucleotide-binding domain-containing protein [Alphaproteobacteria bacterium]